jgi:hypothetical protein
LLVGHVGLAAAAVAAAAKTDRGVVGCHCGNSQALAPKYALEIPCQTLLSRAIEYVRVIKRKLNRIMAIIVAHSTFYGLL